MTVQPLTTVQLQWTAKGLGNEQTRCNDRLLSASKAGHIDNARARVSMCAAEVTDRL